MPSGKHRRQDRLPPALISRESLDKLRGRLKAESIPRATPEPDWEELCRSVQEDRGLTETAAGDFVSITPGRAATRESSPARRSMRPTCASSEGNPQFWREWDELKAAFARLAFWDAAGIVRRSRLSERNWERGGLPNFKNPADRFQTAFDVFCWKWFLYGMERAAPRDRPLVQKIFCTFGPSARPSSSPATGASTPTATSGNGGVLDQREHGENRDQEGDHFGGRRAAAAGAQRG